MYKNVLKTDWGSHFGDIYYIKTYIQRQQNEVPNHDVFSLAQTPRDLLGFIRKSSLTEDNRDSLLNILVWHNMKVVYKLSSSPTGQKCKIQVTVLIGSGITQTRAIRHLILSLSGLGLSESGGPVISRPYTTVSGTALSLSHRMSVSRSAVSLLSHDATICLGLSLSGFTDQLSLSGRIIGRRWTRSDLDHFLLVLTLSWIVKSVKLLSLSRSCTVLSRSRSALSLSVPRDTALCRSLSPSSQRVGIGAADICVISIPHGSLSRDTINGGLLSLSETVTFPMMSLSGLGVDFPGVVLSPAGDVVWWHLTTLSRGWSTLSETGSALRRSLSLNVGTHFLSWSWSSRSLSLTVL
jgi:hypothetical protein